MRSIPVPHFIVDKYKLFAARVTFSKLTICYFIFSVVHCVIQLGLQGRAFSINATASAFLWDIVVQGDAKVDGLLIFGTDEIRVCDTVEDALSQKSCQVVWSGGAATKSVESSPPSSTFISDFSSTSTSILSSSFLPTATPSSATIPTLTRLSSTATSSIPTGTPRPTGSPSELVFVGSDSSDEAQEPGVIVERREHEALGKIQAVDTDGETTVHINGLGHTDSNVTLGRKCLISLNWPAATLDNTKREDIVFIAFQLWVLGMSVVAILNESIPHIIASLFTHMIATGWGAFQVIHTNQFRTSFSRLTTHGACGLNLLPTYWGPRRSAEIGSLTFNCLALLIGLILSWRLAKAFGWRTFKRMGASMQIRTQYTAVLILSVTIQLALFFIVASAGLWLDQLVNGVISRIATQKTVYEVMTGFVLTLLVPWLALGWISVRKEQRIFMAIFLVMSTLYLASWGAMFASTSFRWTFMEWRFFSLMATASVLLTLSALITGIVCRLGFGKGLPEHLGEARNAEDEDGLFTAYVQDDASEISVEKVEFPPLGYPTPTFSAAFRSEGEGTLSEKIQFPNPQMGPRFFCGSSVPFDQQAILQPTPAHTRKQPPTLDRVTPYLYQPDSGPNNHSRANSDASIERSGSGKKRWVIE